MRPGASGAVGLLASCLSLLPKRALLQKGSWPDVSEIAGTCPLRGSAHPRSLRRPAVPSTALAGARRCGVRRAGRRSSRPWKPRRCPGGPWTRRRSARSWSGRADHQDEQRDEGEAWPDHAAQGGGGDRGGDRDEQDPDGERDDRLEERAVLGQVDGGDEAGVVLDRVAEPSDGDHGGEHGLGGEDPSQLQLLQQQPQHEGSHRAAGQAEADPPGEGAWDRAGQRLSWPTPLPPLARMGRGSVILSRDAGAMAGRTEV